MQNELLDKVLMHLEGKGSEPADSKKVDELKMRMAQAEEEFEKLSREKAVTPEFLNRTYSL